MYLFRSYKFGRKQRKKKISACITKKKFPFLLFEAFGVLEINKKVEQEAGWRQGKKVAVWLTASRSRITSPFCAVSFFEAESERERERQTSSWPFWSCHHSARSLFRCFTLGWIDSNTQHAAVVNITSQYSVRRTGYCRRGCSSNSSQRNPTDLYMFDRVIKKSGRSFFYHKNPVT